MSQKISLPKVKIHVRGLVRDKDGNPKFDNPSLIKDYMHLLSESDVIYLENKYGKEFHTNDSGA